MREGSLNFAHEDQYDDNYKNQAQSTGRAIAPAAAVTPVRQRADHYENKNNDEYGAEHANLPGEFRIEEETWQAKISSGRR